VRDESIEANFPLVRMIRESTRNVALRNRANEATDLHQNPTNEATALRPVGSSSHSSARRPATFTTFAEIIAFPPIATLHS
jgi:hypothetical protein